MTLLLPIACLLCAALMGFAIQRGATCTVAAVEEIVAKRSCGRLVSMVEASVWVLCGLLVWRAVHGLSMKPTQYPVGAATLAGGVLLGIGAWVNRACVFGAIARFGSGDPAYLFTPVGFYVGCVVAARLGWVPGHALAQGTSFVLGASAWWAAVFVVYAVWRMPGPWRSKAGTPGASRVPGDSIRAFAHRVWSPHVATAVIGITFLILLLAAGAWTYTDLLFDLAYGMETMFSSRGILLLALLAGAAYGGWTAGRWRHIAMHWRSVLRCTSGGALMALGSLLIPGGNDGLILLGMPLLWPFAWIAFATMCTSIAAVMLIHRRLSTPRSRR